MRFHEIIWPNKYLLTISGLWPMPSDATLPRRIFAHARVVVGLSAVICLMIPEIMTVAVHWGDVKVLGDFGSLIVLHILLTFKILYYVLRRRSFRSMYQHIKNFWEVSKDLEESRHYERIANLAKFTTIAWYTASIGDLLSFDVAALIMLLQNRRIANESLRHRPLFLELDFDVQRTPTYELVFAWQMVCAILAVSAVVGCDCNMMVFVVHLSGQFRLISIKFSAIGRKIDDQVLAKDDELRAEIGSLIAQHQRIIGTVEEMDNLLSPVVFAQIVTSGLGICLSGYAVIEGDGTGMALVNFLVLFVALLMQLIIWCAPAELLIQESTNIAEAIYHNISWFCLSPNLRRDLGFIVLRAQRACCVTALHRNMYVARVTEVFNTAGSYMALLQSMQ